VGVCGWYGLGGGGGGGGGWLIKVCLFAKTGRMRGSLVKQI